MIHHGDGEVLEVEGIALPVQLEALLTDPEQPTWAREEAREDIQRAVERAFTRLDIELDGDPVVEVLVEPAPGQSLARPLS
jgi:hypothetical protein